MVPNGIDGFWLKNIYYDRNTKVTEEIRVIFVGRICKRKNPLATAKACERLIGDGVPIRFTIVGSIDDWNLFTRIKQYSFVEHLGVKNKEELLHIYRDNHIFIMPSLSETFGLVYAEALTQGLPVIYTKGQGFDGHFNEGEVGYSVRSDSSDDIANRILLAVKNYDELVNRCVRLCKKFDWEHITNRYIQIYDEVLC